MINLAKIKTQIESAYEVISSVNFGDGFNTTVSAGSKTFAICVSANEITVYQSFLSGTGWVFLPGSKTVKTFKSVESFISKRLQYA
jgi:hypothetical protein